MRRARGAVRSMCAFTGTNMIPVRRLWLYEAAHDTHYSRLSAPPHACPLACLAFFNSPDYLWRISTISSLPAHTPNQPPSSNPLKTPPAHAQGT